MKSILIASQEKEASDTIRTCLAQNYLIDSVTTLDDCLDQYQKKRYDFLFIDLIFLNKLRQNGDYKPALQIFLNSYPTMEIIIISKSDTLTEAVTAVKQGASNYISLPINPEEVRYITESVQKFLLSQHELDYLRDSFWRYDLLELVQTRTPQMKDVLERVRSVAATKSTVLLIGETGTGKTLLAKLIHLHSNRRDAQFIAVHLGAIPETLIESELFGHEKGAFTGAVKRKLGKFEIAEGGTLFLDEIGTITPAVQIKLLQILQDGVFSRLGGEVTIQANVRIIAATNTDLKRLCDEGKFRTDLYYRLNVFPITLPTLRERKQDIPILIKIILKRLNSEYVRGIYDVHPLVLEAFDRYSWPGNIRELENLMERAYLLESSPILTPRGFPQELFSQESSMAAQDINTSLTISQVRNIAISETERNYLNKLLATTNGSIKNTARAAGISPRQLEKLMKKYSIKKEDFKLHQ